MTTLFKVSPARIFLILFFFLQAASGHAQSLMQADAPGARATGLGNQVMSSLYSPFAALGNPAALALSRSAGFQLISNRPFGYSFLGASNYYPGIGSLAFSISGLQTEELQVERASIAYARAVTDYMLAGTAMHVNTIDRDGFATFSVSMLFLPSMTRNLIERIRTSALPFNPVLPPNRFAFGITVQDLPFSDRVLRSYVEFGAHYRLAENSGPALQTTYATDGKNGHFKLGLAFPVWKNLTMIASVEDFTSSRSGVGVVIHTLRNQLDVVYSVAEKTLRIDFSVQLGKTPLQRAEGHKWHAVELARKGAYSQAMRQVSHSLSFNPVDEATIQLRSWLSGKIHERVKQIEGLFAQADSLIARGRYVKANLTLLDVLEVDPYNKKAKWKLKQIAPNVDAQVKQLARLAVQAYEQKAYDKARVAFDMILKVRQDNKVARYYAVKLDEYYRHESEKLYLRGRGFFQQKNYRMAIASFEEALEVYPENVEARQFLQQARTALAEQKQETERHLAEAYRYSRNNDFYRAYQSYARVLEYDPHNREAIRQTRILRPRVKKYINSLVSTGKKAFSAKEYDKARRIFRTVRELDPDRRDAGRYLARIDREIQKAVEQHIGTAETYFKAGNWKKAYEAYGEVLKLDSGNKVAREMREKALERLGIDRELQHADSLFAAADYRAALREYRRLRKNGTGDLRELDRRIARCLENLSDEVEKYYTAGIEYYTSEYYKRAIEEWNKALEINPNHAKALEYKKKAEQRLLALSRLE